MQLLDSYFKILAHTLSEDTHVFEVEMLASHPVYEGHFPGNPVSPGVCNMQMIKECAEQVIGHAADLVEVKQYRLTGVIAPQLTPRLTIALTLAAEADAMRLTARVSHGETVYIDFKGTLR